MPHRLRRLTTLDTSVPGFYDQAPFVEAERTDPTLLEAYAGIIETKTYSPAYLEYARARVHATAAFLHAALVKDGRQGACVDISTTLSRFLERQGVWNYIVKGATTLTFTKETGIDPTHFWPMFVFPTEAAAGHAWVKAPPFMVVDLSLGLQPYENGEEAHIEVPVLSERATVAEPRLDDLLAPKEIEALQKHLGRRRLDVNDIRSVRPGIPRNMATLGGAWTVAQSRAQIRYLSCGVTAPDRPLEEIESLCLDGRYPIDLWREFQTRAPVPTPPPTA
jgi:hypothetical protein